MKILYSFLSLLLTVLILVECLLVDVFIGREVIYEISSMINKNFFNINMIFLVFLLAFFGIFVIIFLIHKRKNSKYSWSSIFTSGISIMFFTVFFSSFDIFKNFYFASNEFSMLVKTVLRNVFITNFSVGLILVIISFIRGRKNEKNV